MKKAAKNIKFIIVSIVILIISAGIIAGNGISNVLAYKQTRNTADRYVPGTAQFLSMQAESDYYVYKYFNEITNERMIVEIDKTSRQIRKVKTQVAGGSGSIKCMLNDGEVKDIIYQELVSVSITKISLEEEDGLYLFFVTFTASDNRGIYIINPETGLILSRTIKYGKPMVIPLSNNSETEFLSVDELKAYSQQKVPGSVVDDIDIVYDNDSFIAILEFYKDGLKYELNLNARTGDEISFAFAEDDWNGHGSWNLYEKIAPVINITNLNKSEQADSSISSPGETVLDIGNEPADAKLSEDQARFIIAEKAPEATITKITYKTENNRSFYYGKSVFDSKIYLFEIDAVTGVLLEWNITESVAGNDVTAVPTESRETQTDNETTPETQPTEPAATTSPPSTDPTTPQVSCISIERVKILVLSRITDVVFEDIELEKDDNKLTYKGTVYNENTEVDFEIDAYTGTFIKWDLETVDDDSDN